MTGTPENSKPNQMWNLGTLVEYLSRGDSAKENATLQQYVEARATNSRESVQTHSIKVARPRIMWRLSWLQNRTVCLIPSRLPEASVVGLCENFLKDLRTYARERFADPDPLALRDDVVQTYEEISARHWTNIDARIREVARQPIRWLDQELEQILWIRFCDLSAIARWRRDGRMRSNREVAATMSRSRVGPDNAETIRLKWLPAVDRELAMADRWAASLGSGRGTEVFR